MAKRRRKTLSDIMVIGISPALIMTLVASLLFFLLTVFYHGQYEARLTYIFALFVMAAVLIARISMEEGIEYATLFAIPLAIVTGVAVVRFVRFEGALSGMSTMINWALIALVWWCAHKLTWDCTLIDDNEDASGEGLLQSIGVDADTLEHQTAETPTARGQADSETPSSSANESPTWWQRMVDRRRRPHTPGVWVVYFSIAGLLLFGFGQWFISADDVSNRRYVFQLLCVFVASALGLLLTTSFLGLRRYLRQRRLHMPTEMAGAWLGAGVVMIGILLVVCVVLPRPGASVSVSQLPFGIGSPDHSRTHDRALGNDGPEQPDRATRTRPDAKKGGQPGSQGRPGDQSPRSSKRGRAGKSGSQSGSRSQTNGGRESSSGQAGDRQNSNEGGSKRGGSNEGGSKEGGSKEGGGNDQQRRDGGRSQTEGGDRRQVDGKQSGESSGGNRGANARDGGKSKSNRSRGSTFADKSESADRQPSPSDNSSGDRESESSRSFNSDGLLQSVTRVSGSLLKLVCFLSLLGVALFLLWKYREQVRTALLQLIEDLKQLWARLFGGARDVHEAAEESGAEAVEQASPFSSYTDPFASGAADRYNTDQLVRYSFEALEAWARERACGCADEQTPLEFVRHVAHRHPDVAKEAQILGDLYSRVAYGHERISTRRQRNLRKLWSQMRAAESAHAPVAEAPVAN